jgi:PPOX class probable F420-dependent enzyme
MAKTQDPRVELDATYSDANAKPTSWAEARDVLEGAEIFWLTSVRKDGRPHVTPLLAVWTDGALHFCTGAHEQKAKNIGRDPRVVMTTGTNRFREGLDVVIEGEARIVRDEARLRRLADVWVDRFDWKFDVKDGAFAHEGGGGADIYEVVPVRAFAYARGETYSATRYRF